MKATITTDEAIAHKLEQKRIHNEFKSRMSGYLAEHRFEAYMAGTRKANDTRHLQAVGDDEIGFPVRTV